MAKRTTVIHIKDAPPGWEDDPQYVYIGRAGRGHDGYWGNPIRLKTGESRGATLDTYKELLCKRLQEDEEFAVRFWGLQGKTLVCFCKPLPCHGDVMAKELDRL